MSNKPKTDISNEALIDLAYTMAVEPQRFDELANSLDARIDEIHGADSTLINGEHVMAVDKLGQLEPHFKRAHDLMQRQGRRFNYATGSKRFIDADIRPSALIWPDGRIFYTNKAGREHLDFNADAGLDSKRFARGDLQRLLADLKTLDEHEPDKIISVYDLYAGADLSTMKIALTKTVDFEGKTIGRLCTFYIKWLPEMEDQFRSGFNLTPVELEITRAIVSGGSLNELAATRGRSLGTLRKQTKVLLAKLGLRSQIELACIYSGFTQFSVKDRANASKQKPKSLRRGDNLNIRLDDGRNLQYSIAGPASGKPVFFIHGLIGGTVHTSKMLALLTKYKIKLIMVWRPSFAGSDPSGKAKNSPTLFTRDLEVLMDQLKIDTCQILGNISGAIYAYAAAQAMPERITKIVNAGGVIPIETRAQLKLMDPASRVSIYTVRYAPALFPTLIRAVFAKIDAGFDEEFVQSHYAATPVDQNILLEPELRQLMRDQFDIISAQGYDHMLHDIKLQALKWSKYIKGVKCPVVLVHGMEDQAYPIATLRSFVEDRPNYELVEIPDAGQLVYYQSPTAVIEALTAG